MPSQHESAWAWSEAEEAIGPRPHPIGLIVSIGLLVAGELVMGSGAQALPTQGATSLGAALNESLKLGLSGDPAMVLGGALLLMVGVAAFAWMTRRSGLEGYPRFRLDAAHPSGGWAMRNWLLVAVLGLVVWLAVLDGVVKDATGWSGVLPWLASVALIGVCWWKIDRVRGIRLALHVDRAEAIALGVALVAAFAVFALRLGDVPNSLWGDEGGFFTLARDVANGHVTPDFFGLGTYGYPMAGSIYQSIWLGLFGANVWAWRLGSVVAALAAILPLYFLVRATLGRRVAWISIALYAVSPYLLTYARMGYNNAQSITVVVVTMALTWLAVRRDSRLYAFLAGCAGGLGFFTHTSARFGFVLALGWLLWVWITHRARGRSLLMTGGVVLLGVLLVGGPAVAYGVSRYPVAFGDKQAETLFNNVFYARDLYPDEALTASFGLIRVGSQDLFYEPGLYATLLARGIVRTSLSFHTASLVSENYLVGALAEPLGILYLLGLGWCLVRVRRPNYAMWPAWFLVGAFVLSATATFPPRAALMLPIVPALAAA